MKNLMAKGRKTENNTAPSMIEATVPGTQKSVVHK